MDTGAVLLTLAVILVVARLGGWAAKSLGQPAVMGEIAVGVLLGPSVVGSLWPELSDVLFEDVAVARLKVLAQVSLVLFIFATGAALDVDHLQRIGRRAALIGPVSVIVPAVLGLALAVWMHPRFGAGASFASFSLFVAAAMSVTALPVLARILQETGLAGSPLGVLAITCAAIDDVVAWCLLAVVSATVGASGAGDVAATLVLTAVFAVACVTIVRPILARFPRIPTWVAIVLALSAAATTEAIGTHAVFGAFVAGLVMPRVGSYRDDIERGLLPFLLPVFFVSVGLSTRLDALGSAYLWAVALLITATAVVGKLGGATVGARLSGHPWRESAALGILLNTRGLTELVFLDVGRTLGVITTVVFSMFVFMALVTTVATTPALQRVLPAPRASGVEERGLED